MSSPQADEPGAGTPRARAGSVSGPNVGQLVEVQGMRGIVRFSGTTGFATGRWCGVELEEPRGKNDGSVQGKRYFECAPNYGMFVRPSQAKVVASSASAPSSVPRIGRPAGGESLKTPRRTSMLAAGSQAAGAAQRLSGSFGMRAGGASHLPGASGIAARRTTVSGLRSPSSARSASRHSLVSEGGSRPGSRELLPQARNETPSPLGHAAVGEEVAERMQTPTKAVAMEVDPKDEGKKEGDAEPTTPEPTEPQRTPYRPALTMDESSTFGAGSAPTMSAQTVPLKQFEELRLKYKFLEQKRSEDRQRIQEADKMRAEAEQALRVRDKLATKVGTQQEEMRALKAKLKEATSAREKFELLYGEANDAMEILTLDKEMAEERAEQIAQDVAVLREQLDEASASLDVYKQEGDHSAVLADSPDGATALDYAQLKTQSERLKEALVRLRDVSNDTESRLTQRVRQLEREAEAAQESFEEAERYREKLEVAESQIEDLKERLDEALGAEEMIEDLSERNLNLSAKVEEMQSVIENLEALCEVNNEMEETRAEEEQGLKAEIDRLAVTVNDKNRRIDKLEEAMADYQFNIKQYRELVANLQGELQRLREREETQASEVASFSSKTQEMMSLNLQLRSTMLKTKAKAVDLEMRRLEADQATEQLAMTEPFLPDHFFKSEGDALKSVLAFKRLAVKSDILCKQLEQDENTEANVSDEFVATAEVRSKLAQFSGVAAVLVRHLSGCSETEFMKLGALFADAQGTERRLNGLIDVMKKEEFRATDSLPEIRRLTAQMLALADSHVPTGNKTATGVQRLGVAVGQLAFGSDVQLANLFYIEQLLASGQGSVDGSAEPAEVFSAEDRQRMTGEVLPAVASTIQHCKASKAAAVKLLKRSEELIQGDLCGNDSVSAQIGEALRQSSQLEVYCTKVRTMIQEYYAQGGGEEDRAADKVTVDRVVGDLNTAAQEVFGNADATVLGQALSAAQRLAQEVGRALALASDDSNLARAAGVEAPWIKRAAQFKASLVRNAEVEKRTEALNEEIISLARELKLRDQAIQEYGVKTEMLEKRTETMRRQADQVQQLQQLLAAAQKQERTYEEAIESLQGEVDTLERENRKIKQTVVAKAAVPSDQAGLALPTDLAGLRRKIEVLQESVGFLRRENAHLRGKYVYRGAAAVEQLRKPLLVAAAGGPASAEVSAAVREAKTVAREARVLAAMPRLVRLKPAEEAEKKPAWQPLAKKPEFELYRQQTVVQSLRARAEKVQERLHSLARFPALAGTATVVL